MPLTVGARLGPYEITAPIGTGGMGVVYRARDTRLGRTVAVKTLKAEWHGDADRRERFQREARAISALDHPHICPLYDVGEQDGIYYLVMPLVEGETLATRLARGPLPINRTIAVAVQIADALAAAHEAGFVHRDLKPANIMLSKGRSQDALHVTLLDFGLAKLCPVGPAAIPGDVSTQAQGAPSLTASGTFVGTLRYMAPEQLEGKAVDGRTDLFALGTVLYEMLTGRPAFDGDSAASIIAAILEREPPSLSTVNVDIPPALDSIVRRCLAKSPGARFQSAADLAFVLQSVGFPAQGTSAPYPTRRPVAARLWRGAALAVFALAVASAAWMLSRAPGESRSVPNLLNPMQVTNALGVEDYPSWSPDGRTLAYAANASGDVGGGDWDIWVAQVGGGQPLNRTADSIADDRFPTWSPDGRQLAFWSDRDGGGCYLMPALAGGARRVAAASPLDPNPPAWSSDGNQLTCVVLEGTVVFAEIHDLRDGQSRRILLPGESGRRLFLSWSPDLTSFAYIDTPAGLNSDATQLRMIRLTDGATFTIADALHRTWSPSWSPSGDAVYFVSNLGGAMDLWRQPISDDGSPSGQPERVTSGIGMRSARLSPDGTRLAYSQGRRVSNVWRVPILAPQPTSWDEARQVTFDHAFIEFVAVSPDGTRLVVTSDRSGNPDLWILPIHGGEMQHVVGGPTPEWYGAWSPKNDMMAFVAYRTGNRDLWLAPVNGGPARQLTDHPGADLLPSWSPDGKHIAFLSNRGGSGAIWIIPATGGQPTEVMTTAGGPNLRPGWSPDGRWLAVFGDYLWLVSPTKASPERRLARDATVGVWAPDSRKIYFSGGGARRPNIYVVSVDGAGERMIADLAARPGSLGDLTTDGQNIFFTWEESLGDIWVMDVVSPKQ